MQALDHAAGYLLAFGVNAALCKTVTVRWEPSFLVSERVYIQIWSDVGRRIMGSSRVPRLRGPMDTVSRSDRPS